MSFLPRIGGRQGQFLLRAFGIFLTFLGIFALVGVETRPAALSVALPYLAVGEQFSFIGFSRWGRVVHVGVVSASGYRSHGLLFFLLLALPGQYQTSSSSQATTSTKEVEQRDTTRSTCLLEAL